MHSFIMSATIELGDLGENSNQDSLKSSLLTSLKKNNFDQFTKTLNNDSSTINHFYSQHPQPGTLLDIACRTPGNSKFVEILLQHGANSNAINIQTGKSPLHEAVQHSDLDTVRLLAQDPNCNTNITDSDGKRAIFYAMMDCKIDLIDILLDWYESNGENVQGEKSDFENHLFFCMCSRYISTKKLIKIIERDKRLPSNTTQIMKAARYGYCETLEKLLTTESPSIEPINGKSILHVVLDGILASRSITENRNINALFPENNLARKNAQNALRNAYFPPEQISLFADEKQDHYRCLEYILKNIPSNKLDINFVDNEGNTALHYAVIFNETNSIKALLQAGAYSCKANKDGMIPLRWISSEILEQHMDGCISSNSYPADHIDYKIIFDYKMLMSPVKPPLEFSTNKEFYEEIRESEPILVMNDVPRFRKLLIHPLIRSYLDLKWRVVRKYFHYNLILYLIYWFFLSSYLFYFFYNSSSFLDISKTNGNREDFPQYPQNFSKSQIKSVLVDNIASTDGNVTHSRKNASQSMLDISWRILTLIFCTILIIKEGFQAYMLPQSYRKSLENFLELSLFLLTFVLLTFCLNSAWRSPLSATVILASWMELILLIGRHPFFSTYVEMFKTVSLNFLKFLHLYSIMIIAFAFSFFILFKDKTEEDDKSTIFQHFSVSVFKTLIMLTGEYDASTIPFGDSFSVAHVFFILFLFLIAIVLFNLLSGLAVGDTQKITNDAEIVGIVSRIKFIAYVETMAVKDFTQCLDFVDKLLQGCCCFCFCFGKTKKKRILEKIGISTGIPYREHMTPDTFRKKISLSARLNNCRVEVAPNRSRHIAWNSFDPKIIEDTLNILRKTKLIDEVSDHTEFFKQIEENNMKLQKVEKLLYCIIAELRVSKGKFNTSSSDRKLRRRKRKVVKSTK